MQEFLQAAANEGLGGAIKMPLTWPVSRAALPLSGALFAHGSAITYGAFLLEGMFLEKNAFVLFGKV